MPHSHTLTRAVAAALAIAALAAPAALAWPVDQRLPDMSDAAAQSQQRQDLRSPDARDAAQSRRVQDLRRLSAGGTIHTSSLAGTTSDDKRSATARAHAQERYYGSYDDPAPRPQQTPGTGASDDSTPWAIISLALALAIALAGLAAAGVAMRIRRARVPA
jgi:hypothetical protein